MKLGTKKIPGCQHEKRVNDAKVMGEKKIKLGG
jgi:hypothetical protein